MAMFQMVVLQGKLYVNESNNTRKLPGRKREPEKMKDEKEYLKNNIEAPIDINKNEMVNIQELGVKNSLFFRLHVTGLIESANVIFKLMISFTKVMPFIANTT